MTHAIFNILSTFISLTAKTYHNYPLDFDDNISVTNITIKQVQLDNSNKGDNHSKYPAKKHMNRYCALCSHEGFEDQHYLFSLTCGVSKLSSKEIIKIMDDTGACPACGLSHGPNCRCVPNFLDGKPKACFNGCKHNGIPLHFIECKHHDQKSSFFTPRRDLISLFP